jgi:VWFA-related protein
MTALALLALALQGPADLGPAETRSLTVTVTDEKGGPVSGLRADEVVVLENGVARDVSRLEPDTRPLTAVVIVDTSGPVATVFRLNIADEVARLLGRLPPGSRYALWTTGDRPTKVVDFTDEVPPGTRALKRIAPRGGNTVLDAIVESVEDLEEREAERTAVIVVSGRGLGFANYDRAQVVDRALRRGHFTFMVVHFQEGGAPVDPTGLGSGSDASGTVGQIDYDYVFGQLTKKTGGVLEMPLSSMGVGKALEKVSATLSGQYRITYGTLPDIGKREIEVKVARPGVKASLAGSPR